MTLRIKVVHVDVEGVPGKNGKGGYETAEIIYESGGKKNTFKMVSFSNPDGFTKIKNAQKGDEFDIEITKNAGGYNQWSSVAVAGEGTSASVPTTSTNAPSTGSKSSASFGRDFETKEERAARQVLIVKQSSLSAAIATLTPGAKSALDVKSVLDLAQQYTDFVFAAPPAEDIFKDDFPSDIPY